MERERERERERKRERDRDRERERERETQEVDKDTPGYYPHKVLLWAAPGSPRRRLCQRCRPSPAPEWCGWGGGPVPPVCFPSQGSGHKSGCRHWNLSTLIITVNCHHTTYLTINIGDTDPGQVLETGLDRSSPCLPLLFLHRPPVKNCLPLAMRIGIRYSRLP